MEQEALTWTEETTVDWQSIGRQYGIKNKNGHIPANCGQIAKDYLLKKDGFEFKYKGKDEQKKTRVRRSLKRVLDATVPRNPSAKKVKLMLQAEFVEGNISIGESILPRKYTKIEIKQGRIEKSDAPIT